MPHAAAQAAPARTWAATYPGTASQLRHVRADLRPFLADCPLAADVITLVSELAANAVAHSDSRLPGGTFTVRLTHHHGSHVRAEVQDQGSSWDGDLAASARQPHGLYLLLALAARCGTSAASGARTTWFRLDYPPPALRPHEPPGGSPMDTPPPPPHPLPALTTFELRDYRRQLEHALTALPGRAPARGLLQDRLDDVLAEQGSRTATARDQA